MIPPQLLLFAAKHGKKLIYLAIFLLILLGMKMALNYHERVVEDNATLRESLSTSELAIKVEQSRNAAQSGAIQQWKDAHEEIQRQLAAQKKAQAHARVESEKLNETFREHDLTRLAAAKPGLVERAINRGTVRIQRLLVCASAGRECDDNGRGAAAGSGVAPSSATSFDGAVQVDGDGSGVLQRS